MLAGNIMELPQEHSGYTKGTFSDTWVVLPALLFTLGVVIWNKEELDKFQVLENSVWRTILNAPGSTPKLQP